MKILRPEEVTSFPEFRKLSPEEEKQAYAMARAAFTAADLQGYTELDEGIAADQVLRELRDAETQLNQKKP